MGQLHFGAQVDALARRAASDQGGQRPAVPVVALEVGVAERNHQRQEAVDAHEPPQRVPERLLVVLAEPAEPVDRRPEGGVDLAVVALSDQQGSSPLHLADVEHTEGVEGAAGVEQ